MAISVNTAPQVVFFATLGLIASCGITAYVRKGPLSWNIWLAASVVDMVMIIAVWIAQGQFSLALYISLFWLFGFMVLLCVLMYHQNDNQRWAAGVQHDRARATRSSEMSMEEGVELMEESIELKDDHCKGK